MSGIDMYGVLPYTIYMKTFPFHRIRQTTRPKASRLEARLTGEQKRLLQRAAGLDGRSLTDFVLHSAREAAVRLLHQNDAMTLSARDRDVFVGALLTPPRPVPSLRSAALSYRKKSGN
jgi:uncharacterized protein (DUF1778 family)